MTDKPSLKFSFKARFFALKPKLIKKVIDKTRYNVIEYLMRF